MILIVQFHINLTAFFCSGLCLVYRAATKSAPAAEGWIPGHVIGYATNTAKKGRVTPRIVKRNAKKPSFGTTG